MKGIILLGILCIGISGCAQKSVKESIKESTEPASIKLILEPSTETNIVESITTELITEQQTETQTMIDDTIYIGEYLDSAVNEPNLEIAAGENQHYLIQIGIYRLTFLSDGVGELTADGMSFTATDAAGNPISGIITVDGETATVTFTDSTWEYLENGSTFQYTKSSSIPNIE